MSFLDALDPKYRLILCDVWGVVHDGVNLYPGAAERLRQWRERGPLRRAHHQRAANGRSRRAAARAHRSAARCL